MVVARWEPLLNTLLGRSVILVVVSLWPHLSQNIGDSLILVVIFWSHLSEHFGLFCDAGAKNLVVSLALMDL